MIAMTKHALLWLLLPVIALGLAQGTSWTVNQSGSIQAAINGASPGDTIFVENGTYYESLDINKSLILRGINMPIIDGEGNGSTIKLSADGVVLEGFIARNSSRSSNNEGIKVKSNNNTIDANIAKTCWSGIGFYNSKNNSIKFNNVSDNKKFGIYFNHSNDSIIANNSAYKNDYGIYLNGSWNNIIIGTHAGLNDHGIVLNDSVNNTLINNSMSLNHYNFEANYKNNIDASNTADGNPIYYLIGVSDLVIASPAKVPGIIYCFNCRNVTVRGQSLKNNSLGICLYNSSNCLLENNTMENNTNGIILKESNNDTVLNNNVSHNQGYGVIIEKSIYMLLKNNNIRINKNGVHLQNSTNNTLTGNNVSYNKENGISAEASNNNTFNGNNASYNRANGLDLNKGYHNRIFKINASNNGGGICLRESRDNALIGSTIEHNQKNGIWISNTNNSTFVLNCVKYNQGNGISAQGSNNNFSSNNASCNKLCGFDVSGGYGNKVAGDYASNNRDGIYLYQLRDSAILSDVIENNRESGIRSYDCHNISVRDNIAANNADKGIELNGGYGNEIFGNNVSGNDHGIFISSSKNNNITGNQASSNEMDGIQLSTANNNTVMNNSASGGLIGLILSESRQINIAGNTADHNLAGIRLSYSDNNSIEDNYARNNSFGLAILNSSLNEISSNEISGSNVNFSKIGIYLNRSNNNKLRENNVSINRVGLAMNLSNNTLINNTISGNDYNILINDNLTTSGDPIWDKFVNSENIDQDLQRYQSGGWQIGRETAPVSQPPAHLSTSEKGGATNAASGDSSTDSPLPPQINYKAIADEAAGRVVFTPPTNMTNGTEVFVDARIAAFNTTALIKDLRGVGKVQYMNAGIKINMTYKAVLIGDHFLIAPQTGEQTQFLSKDLDTLPYWEWLITPTMPGNRTLTLTIYAGVPPNCVCTKVLTWPVQVNVAEEPAKPLMVTVTEPVEKSFDELVKIAGGLGAIGGAIAILLALYDRAKKKGKGG
jgi:parallel beta-helix repeat protein